MMRILWLGIQSSYSHAATALPLLAQAAQDVVPIEWCRVDGVIADDAFELASRCEALHPDLVCASLYLFNRRAVLAVLERLNVLEPALPMAVGGPECLGDGANELLRQYPFVTYAFRGEGEQSFRKFIQRWREGGCDSIPGVVERNSRGAVVDDGSSGVDEEWISRPPAVCSPFFEEDKPFVQIETSRGCPMGCTYCTSCHTRMRFREIADVEKELEAVQRKGILEIRLLDRTFNLPDERGAALLRLFRTKFPRMHFHLELHPGVLGQGVRQELLQARPGQLFVEVGIQCLSPIVLEAVGRSPDWKSALEGVRFLGSCQPRFDTHVDLLTGLPLQKLEDVFQDVEALLQTGVTEIQMEVLKILPGTPLKRQAAAWKMDYCRETPYDVMRTPMLSLEDMRLCRKFSRMLDLFHNHPALRKVYLEAHRSIRNFTRKFLVWSMENASAVLNAPSALRHRFEILRRYLEKQDEVPAHALDAWNIAWMQQAFPVDKTIPAQMVKLTALSPDIVKKSGLEDSVLKHPNTHVHCLTLHNGEKRLFFYNRALAPNHCIAETNG